MKSRGSLKKTPLVTASGHAHFHAGRANVWEAETKRSDIQGDVVKDAEEEESVPGTLPEANIASKKYRKMMVGRRPFPLRAKGPFQVLYLLTMTDHHEIPM